MSYASVSIKPLSLLYNVKEMNEDPQKVTYFAETDSRNTRKKFGVKAIDRSKHFYVIGKSGMGKSTLLENMATQDIQSGNGVVFIDPHGGTAEKLLEYIPEHRINDVIYFAPFDTSHPIAFNIMEDVGAEKRHLVVNGLMSVFEKIWEDAWSARMAYILQNTLLALLEYPGATLLAVNRMYTDKEFRTKVVENVTDISVKSFWVDEYAKYTDKYAQEATPAIQNKIGQFAGNPLIRNIIGQPKSSFDLRKMMDEKKIMIVNLSKGRVGEGNARLLGSMFITKIYLAAMSRADESASVLSKLPPFYLFVDEFQSFADKSFADILSEARKYKLCLTMAHQYIEQMEEEVRDAVFGNVGSMVTFRVGAYDADVLEKEFAPVFTAEDLVNLGLRQIYLKLMIDSVTSQPFSATTLPPIDLPSISYVKEIIESSRKAYARPRAEVEKAIIEWHGLDKPREPEAKPRAKEYGSKFDGPKAPVSQAKSATYSPPPPPPPPPYPPPPIKPPKLLKKEQVAPPKVSLSDLNKRMDNQRLPDEKKVSALKEALSKIAPESKPSQPSHSQPTPSVSSPIQTKVPPSPTSTAIPPSSPSPKLQTPSEPTPEELRKLLGVE